MATFAYTDASVTINSVDLSDHVKSVALTLDVAALDDTAMGDSWVSNIAGLKSGTVAITFNDDFAESEVDATLWAAFGTVVPIALRPTSSAKSATNPEYSGSVLINQLTVGGDIGALAAKTVTWPTSGTVSRATS